MYTHDITAICTSEGSYPIILVVPQFICLHLQDIIGICIKICFAFSESCALLHIYMLGQYCKLVYTRSPLQLAIFNTEKLLLTYLCIYANLLFQALFVIIAIMLYCAINRLFSRECCIVYVLSLLYFQQRNMYTVMYMYVVQVTLLSI